MSLPDSWSAEGLTHWAFALSTQSKVIGLGVAVVVLHFLYNLTLGLYRVHFHPLAGFKGPRAAAQSTTWYYELSKKGFPETTFEELHHQYGTQALRIGPNELHISDVGQYKRIYSQKDPFPKEPLFYDSFQTPHTLFAELDPALHRERRKALNPMFSRMNIFRLEPVIQDKISLMMRKVHRLYKKGSINVYDGFRCLTTEIVMEFAFAKSAGLIEESPDSFYSWFVDGIYELGHGIGEMQYRPLVAKAFGYVPPVIMARIVPALKMVFAMQKFAADNYRHYKKHGNTTNHPVAFEALSMLSEGDMVAEAMDLLIAGADTTALTLTTAIHEVVLKPKILERLVGEIDKVSYDAKGQLPLRELEKLDYLTAVVKESLRLAMAVPGRLPRLVPQGESFVVDGVVIPPGTIVGMSAYTMHFSEELWGKDAREFNPDRWLDPNQSLDQYLVTFSKGARMCIGQSLAPAEITIALATIFRQFHISLAHDYKPPVAIDLFTKELAKPGLSLEFQPR